MGRLIVTVTLNPAVDEEYMVPEFHLGGWFRASSVRQLPGGKGINVSVILKQLNYDSVAMGFLAGFNGEYIRDAMRRMRISTNFVHVKGETRTNVYIVDPVGHMETGIAAMGPYISEEALSRFTINYDRMLKRASLVAIGGSLPPGVSQDYYRTLVEKAKAVGVPVFLDAAGPPLSAALELVPTAVRIDHRFISVTLGYPIDSLDKLVERISQIHAQGVEWAITACATHDGLGNIFYTPNGIYVAETDVDQAVSMIGAGDALMAGLIVAYKEGMDTEMTVRFAMACLWEEIAHPGHGIGGMDKVKSLVSRVRLEKLD